VSPIVLEIIVVCLGVALLMVEAFASSIDKKAIALLGAAGLAVTLGLSFVVDPALPAGAEYAAYYASDPLAMFFKRFSLVATILVLLMSLDYASVIEKFVPGTGKGAGVGEFFALPVLTCAGLMWLVSATDFIMIFVALELVTISFYVLVAYMRKSPQCLEAGTKYLILGALSTGFLVYGITWVFGVTGETNLDRIAMALPELPASSQTALLFGIGLVLVGLGFKIAAAPFQFWVPDVYQGAPTPVTAFLSVGSKAAGFVVLLRVVEPFLVVSAVQEKLLAALAVLAGITLVYGNFAALPQTNMKRLLSYSSIAHAGYLLMGVVSVGAAMAGNAIAFYLTAYLLMTFLAFIVLLVVAKAVGGDDISHFNGLARRSPWLAAAMLVSMLSLAGIPFTAGFLGKLFIFRAALLDGHFWLVGIGAVAVACGFYYYLKIVRAMYWQPAAEDAPAVAVSKASAICLWTLGILIFVLGVYPQPILASLH
jgi:NADH-quinone oxidoreductase subunit N